jgi:hypothetical protein
MKLTQICFDCIDADGRKWAAIISHTGGIRTVRSLRGKRDTPKATARERTIVNAPRVDAVNGLHSPGSPPFVSREEVVLYAKDTN